MLAAKVLVNDKATNCSGVEASVVCNDEVI